MSELNNPLAAIQPEAIATAESHLPPASDPINPNAENPTWTGVDLFLMGLILITALLVSTTTSVLISALFSHHTVTELSKDPSTLAIIPAMVISYLIVMAFMYFRLTGERNAKFWEAVSWRWPRGNKVLGFLAAGGVTAIALGLFSRLLPMPKSLPVDRFFGDRRSAYLMVFFGVLIAPLAEELLFRGFLYPVLDRWLETSFMFPQRLRRGGLWIFIIAIWGNVVHLMPSHTFGLLAAFAPLPVVLIFLALTTQPGGKPAHTVLLPGMSLLIWGFVMRPLTAHVSFYATAVLLGLAIILLAIGSASAWKVSSAATVGRILAVLITSAAFAMMHSDQLGSAWAPLLVLFTVGCILTLTRVLTRAVAPGVLLHMGYNATLFSLLYVATDRFRHLERMTQ